MLEELEEDIREHIAMETHDKIPRGISAQEARYAAMRKFGNLTRVKETDLPSPATRISAPPWDRLASHLAPGHNTPLRQPS